MTEIGKNRKPTPKVIQDQDHCMIIASSVRGVRNALGLSQTDLAELLGVTRSTLVRLEQGVPPLKVALCKSAMEVFEETGVTSRALKDVLLIGEGYPAVVDFSIEFHHLKHIKEKMMSSPNSRGIGKLLLGQQFSPPLSTTPLRRKNSAPVDPKQ